MFLLGKLSIDTIKFKIQVVKDVSSKRVRTNKRKTSTASSKIRVHF